MPTYGRKRGSWSPGSPAQPRGGKASGGIRRGPGVSRARVPADLSCFSRVGSFQGSLGESARGASVTVALWIPTQCNQRPCYLCPSPRGPPAPPDHGRAEEPRRDASTGPQHQAADCLSPTWSLPACEANAPQIPPSREKVPLCSELELPFQVPPPVTCNPLTGVRLCTGCHPSGSPTWACRRGPTAECSGSTAIHSACLGPNLMTL